MKTRIPTLLIIFSITCLAFLPEAEAVSPPPDGGYPGGNTAEGALALGSLTTGFYNTAVGIYSILSLTDGSFCTGIGAGTLLANTANENTATGAGALLSNTIGGQNTATGAFALFSTSSGAANTADGDRALLSNTAGNFNTAVGFATLLSNITGTDNTANGASALFFNSASGNTAVGSAALLNNTTGGTLGNVQGIDVGPNVAVGWEALESNTLASANTAIGYQALQSFTTGPMGGEQLGLCTAVGFQALANATTGFGNSGFGYRALMNNTGAINTAVGAGALSSNTTGGGNTASGVSALFNNTTGSSNTAIGLSALAANVDGNFNVAIGENALTEQTSGDDNTAIGAFALQNNSNGFQNTAIGSGAGFNITGDGNVCIGQGVSGEVGVDNLTYIRNVNTFTQNFSAGVNDYVTVRLSDGRLGHTAVVSSRRYKEDIKPLAATSEALYALKPVSFRLKKKYDETQALGFGLIAEEVAEVNSDLVYRNAKGQVESVRYEMVNAMLLNEFLKAHEKVEEQQQEIAALKAELKEQRDLIQKVSDKLKMKEAAELLTKNP